jgi:hypothetical protein
MGRTTAAAGGAGGGVFFRALRLEELCGRGRWRGVRRQMRGGGGCAEKDVQAEGRGGPKLDDDDNISLF